MSEKVNSETSRYLAKVDAFPRLSREAELELIIRWQQHADRAARRELINANLRHAVAIAWKYSRYGLPLVDLISEGNFGLVTALAKFDPTRGTRFVTYAAYWIRASILNYVILSWSLVGAGSEVMRSKLFFRIGRERSRIMNLIGDESATNSLLATQFGVSPEKMRIMTERLSTRDVSLDTPTYDDGSTTLLDTLVSPDLDQEQRYSMEQDSRQLRRLVTSSIATLDKRERYIVIHRLMRPTGEELSLAEIGRTWGVSRERARQLEMRARKKVKRHLLESGDGEPVGAPPQRPAA